MKLENNWKKKKGTHWGGGRRESLIWKKERKKERARNEKKVGQRKIGKKEIKIEGNKELKTREWEKERKKNKRK